MEESNYDRYRPIFIRFSPNSIPQIVAHIQKWLVEHPYISVEAVAQLIEEALQEHPELINGSVIPITEDDEESIKDYIDALPVNNTYTKSETDALLAGKEDTLTFDNTPRDNSTNPVTSVGIYTAINDAVSIIDAALALKADKIDTYTKTAVDNLLIDKADKSDTYSKNTIEAKLATKADISDVVTIETAEQIMDDIAIRTDGTAPSNLTAGQFVLVDGDLYKLTADVQTGDTLTVGTNIQVVSEGGLNSLKSDVSSLSGQIGNLNGAMLYVENGDTWSGTDPIPSGAYIQWKGSYYKTTSQIPASTAISGHVTSIGVGGAVNELNAQIVNVNKPTGTAYNIINNTSGGSATLTQDGILLTDFVVGNNTQTSVEMTINGVVRQMQYAATANMVETKDSFVCYKGDIITVTTSGTPYRALVKLVPY